MKNQLFLFVFAFLSFNLLAQPIEEPQTAGTDLSEFEQKMIQYGKTILTDTLVENRKKAHSDLGIELMANLSKKGSFSYPFDSVQSISIQYPSDTSFRIITWQLYVDINEYQYAGFIQTNAEQPKVVKLNDRSVAMDDMILDFEIMTADNWYGAIYYNIMSFESPEGPKHLLFGYDGFQFFNKRKIIDVLYFQNGTPIFGAPVFAPLDPRRTDLTKNRILMQYAAGSNITLNFNKELDIIMFDNLIPHNNMGGQPSYVPDGSYRGYRLENGQWTFVDKVFDHIYESAPRPAPVLDKGRKVDIMGRKQ